VARRGGNIDRDNCSICRPPLDSSKAARALHRAALKTNCQTDSGSVRHLSNVRPRATFQSSVHALEPNGRRAVVMGAWKIGPRSAWLLVPAQTASQHSPAPQVPSDLIYPVPALGADSPQLLQRHATALNVRLRAFFSMRSRRSRLSPGGSADAGKCSARHCAQSIGSGVIGSPVSSSHDEFPAPPPQV
jgi:hypothetical protein